MPTGRGRGAEIANAHMNLIVVLGALLELQANLPLVPLLLRVVTMLVLGLAGGHAA